jgi:uncharacterized membrane protein YcaP (DUF421 family)
VLPSIPAWELIVRAVLIYAALLIALRLFGKREIGQFTLYDLVFILLVANALQPAMTGPDTSLVGGLILIVTLVAANYLVSRLELVRGLSQLFSPPATMIIRHGRYLPNVLRREGVDRDEVETAMREHGVEDIKEVELAMLEPDGSISIVPKGSITSTKRRVRFHRRT